MLTEEHSIILQISENKKIENMREEYEIFKRKTWILIQLNLHEDEILILLNKIEWSCSYMFKEEIFSNLNMP